MRNADDPPFRAKVHIIREALRACASASPDPWEAQRFEELAAALCDESAERLARMLKHG